MSAALARLRNAVGDALLVRQGAEMQPTSRAQALLAPVQSVLDTVRGENLQRPRFVPAELAPRQTIVTPDVGEAHFLLGLLRCFTAEAPAARLRTLSLPPRAAAEALESGAADLAVGDFPICTRPASSSRSSSTTRTSASRARGTRRSGRSPH